MERENETDERAVMKDENEMRNRCSVFTDFSNRLIKLLINHRN